MRDERGWKQVRFNIAIDVPAGAGKRTIAKNRAKKISFVYVDTGAMDRARGYYFVQHGIRAEEEKKIREACENISVTLAYEGGVQKVLLNGKDISDQIRQEEVGNMASATSGYGFVRAKLLSLQQDMAAQYDVIMDGRDIGTTVLPDANVHIYLTSISYAIAIRIYDELKAKGEECDLQKIKEDIEQRDYQDMHRDISPLKQADDAVLVDSSDMGIDEVVEAIKTVINKAK